MTTTNHTLRDLDAQRKERMMRELQSDLADMVEAGDITDEEANEWANAKAEQWNGGDR